MNFGRLPYKNITFYARYHRLIAMAALITIAVIVGSLVVGDSVRTTLVNRVNERLGNIETIIFSRNSFMSEELLNTSLFSESTRGILLVNGFISQGGKLLPVFVWGVDDKNISTGKTRINPALAKEINPNERADIVVRLPATGLVPSGSLFVTENYTTSLRLTYDGIVEAAQGGNMSMKNEQVIPFNLFVNRKELAEILETDNKINLILADERISGSQLSDVWNYKFSGLSVNQKEGFAEIVSDRVFIQKEVVDYITKHNVESNRMFSYLANAIEKDNHSVPYSFVTATDRYKGEQLRPDEIILSDYTANRLKAIVGDTIDITYFTSQDLKTLSTKALQLTVNRIVPLAELQADESLSADFPGLSDVERCTDWDSDLPINMNLITDEDEKYWDLYRSTPKAIIAYEAVHSDWGNAYGNATALRVAAGEPHMEGLQAGMFGIQLIHPREAGIYAAKNGVDFSSLFLALGFFIIISAILLMLIPLSEMLLVRKNETNLLSDLGFPRKRIIQMLWKESVPVVIVSSVVGVIAGLFYTSLVMWLLGSVWKGATQTDGFSVYPSFVTLAAGLFVGVGLSLWLLRRAIVRSLKEKKVGSRTRSSAVKTKKRLALLFSIFSVATIGVNLIYLQSVALFIIIGIFLLGTAALWGDYLICSRGAVSGDTFQTEKLVWNTLYANRKQAVLSFFALSAGVFIVFSVGLNRKGFADSSQIKTGTGGYSLWVESAVPVYHNMMTEEGRGKLALTGLPANVDILQCLRYSVDDASCLNLNKVSAPTVLGVDMNVLAESDFQIVQSLQSQNRESVFGQMTQCNGDVYPVLVDATVLTWGLMKNIGDTLIYESDNGREVALRIIGALSNSIFQGNILIDQNLFNNIWPETAGSEVFLVKVGDEERGQVKNLIAQALHAYGVSVSTTNDRLKQFNAVTDTYLTIFLTLGGLGLLLGIMSFIIVVRKNLVVRRNEIALYETLGFSKERVVHILYRENILVPLYAIAVGVISSLIGVGISFMNTGIRIWTLALLFALFFVICIMAFVYISVKSEVHENSVYHTGFW